MLSLLVYRATQNNLGTLAATLLKLNDQNNSTWVKFNSFTFIKCTFSSSVFFKSLILIVYIKTNKKCKHLLGIFE